MIMSNTALAAAGLSLVVLLLLIALAFKLRQWIRTLHAESTTLRNEVHALKASTQELGKKISDASLESVNASCLTPLGLKFPVFLGGWSIDAFFSRWLVQHLLEKRPKCIVELGSGSSTVLIARTLNLLGMNDVTHLAVDHEEKYLGLTRDVAALNGVAEQIQFLHCPLKHHENFHKLWYSGLEEKMKDLSIDLLLIDGPPGPLQPLSRLPAMRILMPFMNHTCTIVLDDANRTDEQAIAKQWAKEHPDLALVFQPDGHGIAVLTR